MTTQTDRFPLEGERWHLTTDVERGPHFTAAAGMRGTIVEATRDLVRLKLDDHLPGAEEWDNEVCWTPENCEDLVGYNGDADARVAAFWDAAPLPPGWCHECDRDIDRAGDHAPGCGQADLGPEHPSIAPTPETVAQLGEDPLALAALERARVADEFGEQLWATANAWNREIAPTIRNLRTLIADMLRDGDRNPAEFVGMLDHYRAAAASLGVEVPRRRDAKLED